MSAGNAVVLTSPSSAWRHYSHTTKTHNDTCEPEGRHGGTTIVSAYVGGLFGLTQPAEIGSHILDRHLLLLLLHPNYVSHHVLASSLWD